MQPDRTGEFEEIAKEFRKPSIISKAGISKFQISSELTPKVREYENKYLLRLSQQDQLIMNKWRDKFEVFCRHVGYNFKIELTKVKFITKLANYMTEIKDFADAIYLHDLILREYPEDIRSLNNKSICLAELGKFSQAIELTEKAIKVHPDYFDSLFNNANFLIENGEDDKGLPLLISLLEKFPDREKSILASLIRGYSTIGDLEKTIEYYEKSEEKGFINSDIKLALGNVYERNGNFRQSLKIYEEILSDEPYNYNADINRTSCLIELKLKHTALDVLNRLDKLYPKDPSVLANLALVHSAFGRQDMAIILALKAMEHGFDRYLIRNYLGLFYSNLGDYKEGIRYYDRALLEKKDCYFALGNKSNNLIFLKRHKESIEVMYEFLKHKPNEASILHNIDIEKKILNEMSNWPEEFRHM